MIHIVVHCYAAELPQYASFLRYQLSSLALHPPRIPYLIEVCHSPDDKAVKGVIDWFASETNIHLEARAMVPPERLFRRAIGRNECALGSHAELVWFSDCDYVFGAGCLDGLYRAWECLISSEFPSMLYPRQILTMRSHEDGDLLARTNPESLASASVDLFEPQAVHKAFGGLQIVPGSLARKHGYLDGSKRYQKPLDKPFSNFHCDVAFRKTCLQHGPIVPIDIPNLYRLRHTKSTYYKGERMPGYMMQRHDDGYRWHYYAPLDGQVRVASRGEAYCGQLIKLGLQCREPAAIISDIGDAYCASHFGFKSTDKIREMDREAANG